MPKICIYLLNINDLNSNEVIYIKALTHKHFINIRGILSKKAMYVLDLKAKYMIQLFSYY